MLKSIDMELRSFSNSATNEQVLRTLAEVHDLSLGTGALGTEAEYSFT
jgi:hypothetical protein